MFGKKIKYELVVLLFWDLIFEGLFFYYVNSASLLKMFLFATAVILVSICILLKLKLKVDAATALNVSSYCLTWFMLVVTLLFGVLYPFQKDSVLSNGLANQKLIADQYEYTAPVRHYEPNEDVLNASVNSFVVQIDDYSLYLRPFQVTLEEFVNELPDNFFLSEDSQVNMNDMNSLEGINLSKLISSGNYTTGYYTVFLHCNRAGHFISDNYSQYCIKLDFRNDTGEAIESRNCLLEKITLNPQENGCDMYIFDGLSLIPGRASEYDFLTFTNIENYFNELGITRIDGRPYSIWNEIGYSSIGNSYYSVSDNGLVFTVYTFYNATYQDSDDVVCKMMYVEFTIDPDTQRCSNIVADFSTIDCN